MTKLDHVDGFAALCEALSGARDPASFKLKDPGGERMRRALKDPEASELDLAILLRQVLLAAPGGPVDASAPLPLPRPVGATALAAAGLKTVHGQRVRARAWRPPWIFQTEFEPDAVAAQAADRRFGIGDLGPQADPFVRSLGHDRYRSVGQRAAVRAALLTPAGRSLVIDLPTGEGKSLVFRAIDRFGFATSPRLDAQGVTLVVVPTVALAYDHENACRTGEDEYLAYVGTDADRRARILERLAAQQSGLVFTAPEAAVGSLRPSLIALARAGRLKALVLDEAHLVDAWGTGFRPEFQSLSGLRLELLEQAPVDAAPRTILLSATLTPETLDTLEVLFAAPEPLELLSAAQVRPEPVYYVAPSSDEPTRHRTIEEALLRIPRPAILYVTKVADAVQWAMRFRDLGFRRFAAFHGDTPDEERIKTLQAWRDGRLDLVVATSAFGLGIDYPHVRSVLHACVPETFDRFYQEVGRGGRDGRTCLSLIAPTSADIRVARGLNRERVITTGRGLQRWSAMFHHPDSQHLGGHRLRIRLDVAPGPDEDDIDLIGERSLQWNARVLTLMARAGLLRMVGGVAQEEDASGVFETVEILDTGHLEPSVWTSRVEPVRADIAAARSRNLALMLRHLKASDCPSVLVETLYRADRILAGCSTCGLCRSNPAIARPQPLRTEPASPWAAPPVNPPLADLMTRGELVVTYAAEASGGFAARRTAAALAALWACGLRLLRFIGVPPLVFGRALADLAELPIMIGQAPTRAASRLPSGPEIVLVGQNAGFRLATDVRQPRVVLLPQGYADPDRPGEGLLERYNGSTMSLEALLGRLST
ncbi:protein DpdF [Mesorhizobium sp.]|uniref:protein DpdF n=1 Tax=Mesorhizobium sp. TaxID=1871066 RepID=UPI000FEA7A84|nr:protein DpdF [Mesorhizobium sp.]RWO55373.1 MAG: ATP-dependent DNA helicase RecQ [Mesorhizobium sp.]